MQPGPHELSEAGVNPPGLTRRKFVSAGGLMGSAAVLAAVSGPAGRPGPAIPMTPSGVVPKLAVSAGLQGPRSECGIGALVPWADRLWLITYVAHKAGSGSGTGLYEIDGDFNLRKRPESVVGTYANRFVHAPTTQMIIGPHIIDAERRVRTFRDLADSRLTATMTHLVDPANKVYFLGMEGEFWEADVRTLRVQRLFDLCKELELPKGSRPHFKGAFTAFRRVVVANNTYDERDDVEGVSTGGRLAEWTGLRWEIIERTAFCDVSAAPDAHGGIFATGWDRASVILKVYAKGKWSTYRLPKGSHCHDHAWYTEWPRIREVETERFLMDAHGLFYELPRMVYGGHLWGVKPICQHLRQVPDFCCWRGMLVMAGDEAAPVERKPLRRRGPVQPLVRHHRRPLALRQAAGLGRPVVQDPRSARRPFRSLPHDRLRPEMPPPEPRPCGTGRLPPGSGFPRRRHVARVQVFRRGEVSSPRVPARLQRPLGPAGRFQGVYGDGAVRVHVNAVARSRRFRDGGRRSHA